MERRVVTKQISFFPFSFLFPAKDVHVIYPRLLTVHDLCLLSRFETFTDLIRSVPTLPLCKCLGYFLLVTFGIELLASISYLINVLYLVCTIIAYCFYCFNNIYCNPHCLDAYFHPQNSLAKHLHAFQFT